MQVTGYSLPLVSHPSVDSVLIHPHQAAMIDAWNEEEAILLVTKTGSGKTAATVLPLALSRNTREDNCAVFVYPTNELIRDQESSIDEWLSERLGVKTRLITPASANEPTDDSEIEIVRIDAQILEQFCGVWGLRTMHGKPDKGRALERLLNATKARIILINPDILYLVYSLRYGRAQNAIASLQAFQTIVFDEFHLYQGVELAHILYLIHAAREFGAFRRVVLLSATPHPEVRTWIDKLLSPYEITMDSSTTHSVISQRQVAYDVNLTVLRRGRSSVSVAKDKIIELLPRLRKLRSDHVGDTDYVPAVIIFNSVVAAIDLEQQLLEVGFRREQIVPIRGMSARSVRRLTAEQLLVVGTSAIEVGIDFQCDYLLFEASDAASFMQRFGRLGRHMPGTAFLFGSQREYQVLKRLPSIIPRNQLEQQVAWTYPEADARAWFVGTELGAFAAVSQAFSLRERIYRDRENAEDTDEIKRQIFDRLDEMMSAYGSIMDIERRIKGAKRLFWRWIRGKTRWVGDYLEIDSFRTGMPSVKVRDQAEAHRRGAQHSIYRIDVKALLARADEIKRSGEIYEISGYGRYRRVIVNKAFNDEPENQGYLLSTAEYSNLMLKRGPELEDCSHVMSRTGIDHIFVFVPYNDVRHLLDWRLATFPCGTGDAKFVLAFDGDALLLKEIWKRARGG